MYIRAQTAKNLTDVENNWAIYESGCILEHTYIFFCLSVYSLMKHLNETLVEII